MARILKDARSIKRHLVFPGHRAASLPACIMCTAAAISVAFIQPASANSVSAGSGAATSNHSIARISASTPPQGGFCAAPGVGAPCAQGGVASQGSPKPVLDLGIGNPVHLASGNKYQLDIDLPSNANAPGLEMVRHYNGLSVRHGALGRNWSLSYDIQLLRGPHGWYVRQADGSIIAAAGVSVQGDGFRWQWPNGRQLDFNPSGRLQRIRQDGATQVFIRRHPSNDPKAGMISRVESPRGHALSFHYINEYDAWLVSAIDTPLGRYQYQYEAPAAASNHYAARLIGVLRPDGLRRIYHYEAALQAGNPYALTGISLAQGDHPAKRLATWKYDGNGRVIEIRQHGRDIPVIQLDYLRAAQGSQTGHTRIRTSHGHQQHVYFRNVRGRWRITHRSQDGSASEAPSGIEYDAQGRLTAVGALRLQRSAGGELVGVQPAVSGWPGLSLRRHPKQRRYSWSTATAGETHIDSDAYGRPSKLEYANGDTLALSYDAHGRPSRLDAYSAASNARQSTRLKWRGRHLIGIQHPAEIESRNVDFHGRIRQRKVQRPSRFGVPSVQFQESFSYDVQGRLVRHDLPEGGALLYEWHEGKTLAALNWQDASGTVHTVLHTPAAQAGYQYGNGVRILTAAQSSHHVDTLEVSKGAETLWRQQRRYDAAGRVRIDDHFFPQSGHREQFLYDYDARSRLQAARAQVENRQLPSDEVSQWWYAWHDDGSLAAYRQDGHTNKAQLSRDRAGLPATAKQATSSENYRLHYGASRRLEMVTADDGQPIAQYMHNAFGHRIAKHHDGKTTHFLYLDNTLVAEAQAHEPDEPPTVARRYLYAGATPVGLIDYESDAAPRLYAVHADLAGAPRLITDEAGVPQWLARYTPLGKATRVQGKLDFPLRFLGQYEDSETGWHDNVLRTYAPEWGHYLEPDPLGPLPMTDAYGYAAQQPWRYADPHGLLLFAFDGTRYSADSRANVWTLAQAYQGDAYYLSGPGNSYYLDWDAVVAWRAGQILENQWQALLTALERQPRGATTPVNVLGFSRGAALARHFGNRVAAHTHNGLFEVVDPMRGLISVCVDLRFMGLFDTVAQFGVAGSHNHLYDLGISELWSWVSHAVALHEHRWTFPLTSADAGDAGNVVEAGFIGAHADIGGGVALASPPNTQQNVPMSAEADADAGTGTGTGTESDLAKLALSWMHWQALAASVDFDELSEPDAQVSAPFLRDMRHPFIRTVQRGDRGVFGPGGSPRHLYQDEDTRLGKDARAQTEAFIQRKDSWRSHDSEIVGTVDLEGYGEWLQQVLGWSPEGHAGASN